MADFKTVYCEKAEISIIESDEKGYHVQLITDTGKIDSWFSKPVPNGIGLGDICNSNLVTTDSRSGDRKFVVSSLKTENNLYEIYMDSDDRKYKITTEKKAVVKKFKFGDILYGNLDFIR